MAAGFFPLDIHQEIPVGGGGEHAGIAGVASEAVSGIVAVGIGLLVGDDPGEEACFPVPGDDVEFQAHPDVGRGPGGESAEDQKGCSGSPWKREASISS